MTATRRPTISYFSGHLHRLMTGRLRSGMLVFAMLLAACESAVAPAPSSGISVSKVAFATLPGWQTGNPENALGAWRNSCKRLLAMDPSTPLGGKVPAGKAGDWRDVCSAIIDLSSDPADVRAFIEGNFTPYAVSDGVTREGLFTGYFEPIVRASERTDNAYNVPIHGLPRDHITVHLKDFDPELTGRALVGRVEGGRLRPYPARATISGSTGEDTPVLYWADDLLDVFILQVQGSGIVELPDGELRRIGFAGHNGHDYVSIGRWLIEQKELRSGGAAWQDIRAWMERNPERVTELLARNRRYIFFRDIDGDGAQGAAGVVLTPEHSIAVDRKFLPLNVPLWLDTVHPGPDEERLQRLVLAQDVGNAIRGAVRGDFFWGVGPDALALAGRMKSPGTYYLLLPNRLRPPS